MSNLYNDPLNSMLTTSLIQNLQNQTQTLGYSVPTSSEINLTPVQNPDNIQSSQATDILLAEVELLQSLSQNQSSSSDPMAEMSVLAALEEYLQQQNPSDSTGQPQSNYTNPLINNIYPQTNSSSGQFYDAQSGFDIKSTGDPHISTTIDGKTSKVNYMKDVNNLADIWNTNGGATDISTKVTTPNAKGVDYNKEVDISHAGYYGVGAWNLTAKEGKNNQVSATVTDVNINGQTQTHTLKNNSSYTESDGTTFTMKNGKLSVTQGLDNGGTVTENISGNGKGLDVEAKSQNGSLISGAAVNTLQSQLNPADFWLNSYENGNFGENGGTTNIA